MKESSDVEYLLEKLIDYCAPEVLWHAGLLVTDMLLFSNSSVIRLRAVTVSLVHTMGPTQCADLLSRLVTPSDTLPFKQHLSASLNHCKNI